MYMLVVWIVITAMACETRADTTSALYLKGYQNVNSHFSHQNVSEQNASYKFRKVIDIHNNHLEHLQSWRRLMARHSSELAALIKSFPGAEDMNEKTIQQLFAAGTGQKKTLSGKEIFEPWNQWWSGTWSNGTMQYHIWHATEQINDQWIQTVTQSESGFVNVLDLSKKLRKSEVDLGINVYSPATGISGWVTKRQNGRLEVPHIGYLYDAGTIIWICQPQHPGALFHTKTTWFIFLETVEQTASSLQYHIHGQSFQIVKNGIIGKQKNKSIHHGVYHAQKPEMAVQK